MIYSTDLYVETTANGCRYYWPTTDAGHLRIDVTAKTRDEAPELARAQFIEQLMARDRRGEGPQHGSMTLSLPHPISWAALLKRTFRLDILRCPHCGARRRVLAAISSSSVVTAVLRHLGLPHQPPPLSPSRGPPASLWA